MRRNNSRQRSPRVQFNPVVKTITTLSRRDLTASEQCAAWYKQHDFARFKNQNRFIGITIQRFRNSPERRQELSPHTLDTEEEEMMLLAGDISRGIEHLCCPMYYIERKKQKQAVVQAVVVEQRKQRYMQLHDQNSLAHVSRIQSNSARELASALGRLDEATVRGMNDIFPMKQRKDHYRFNKQRLGLIGESLGLAKAKPQNSTQEKHNRFNEQPEVRDSEDWATFRRLTPGKCKRTPALVFL